ncbi:MAG: indole-3-glycerol phosphate synthase TrpC [Salinivirgaceae bacterium]|nr:indole-3-glycerol phosphate synthase TrpC [Salinivirgaceae bacterium]
MSTILDTILAKKKRELVEIKKLVPIETLQRIQRKRKHFSLKDSLLKGNSSGIIAEFKRKSPSKDWINKDAKTTEIVPLYEKYGAAGSSILTDTPFFGGSITDLIKAGELVNIPILRKDFIIDEYQIIEAAKFGADAILLIAACLSCEKVKALAKTAKENHLEVLLEIHNEQELAHICDDVTLVGVNNRNLKTFKTSLETSIELSNKIPDQFIKISESGISSAEDIKLLQTYGFKGFLVGESFMKTSDPGKACMDFIHNLKTYSHEN